MPPSADLRRALARRARLIAIALFMFGGGCSGGQSDSDLEQVDISLQSASATIDLVGEEARDGNVPRRYVDQLIEAIDKDLQTQQKQIQKADDPKTRRSEV